MTSIGIMPSSTTAPATVHRHPVIQQPSLVRSSTSGGVSGSVMHRSPVVVHSGARGPPVAEHRAAQPSIQLRSTTLPSTQAGSSVPRAVDSRWATVRAASFAVGSLRSASAAPTARVSTRTLGPAAHLDATGAGGDVDDCWGQPAPEAATGTAWTKDLVGSRWATVRAASFMMGSMRSTSASPKSRALQPAAKLHLSAAAPNFVPGSTMHGAQADGKTWPATTTSWASKVKADDKTGPATTTSWASKVSARPASSWPPPGQHYKGKGKGKGDAEKSTAHCDIGRQLLLVSMGIGDEGPKRQVRLIVSGLMGSGKSTLCRMLAHLLEGVWVNQDEFSHKGKGAKKAFLAEIERVAQSSTCPVVLVDKINTMRQHRREILTALNSGVPGDVALLEMRHPLDAPGRYDHAVKLCESRIHDRGAKHRTLAGDNPELHKILSRTAKDAEPMQKEESRTFRARIGIDMTLTPITALRNLLGELFDAGLLKRFDYDDLLGEHRLMEAWQSTQEAEAHIGAGAAPAATKARREPSPSLQRAKEKKAARIWLWSIDFDADTEESLRQLWASLAHEAPGLHRNGDLHVTLLYVGNSSEAELGKKYPQLGSAGVGKLLDELGNRDGFPVELQVTGVTWSGRIAAATVTGLEGLCANAFPHITLAMAAKVPPVKSNELLARRAAEQDMVANLGAWLLQLGLSEQEEGIRQWCSTAGATSPEDLIEKATEVAAACKNLHKDTHSVERALGQERGAGNLQHHELASPLRLTGRVVGRPRS
eukprot:gnl/TRDRNA2_/TRDRNA2_131108_c0_seq1.p1 gnl/TRDRNA2_/TRDRNA2_131108_c0~~gnl/TRDRNA2_/TRDRNA2_131108_c0_seq1.p1  ORF type:complete len:783 (+),score=121.65 gnl/TRDRNA2_/TRDRNA2_131108_c0_seq1:52-2349(+)